MKTKTNTAATVTITAALLVAAVASCDPQSKSILRTVVDVARSACELFAAEQGLSVSDVCAKEEQVRPFVDSLLAAKRGTGLDRKPACPEASSSTAPESSATPSATVSAPPTETK